MKRLLPIALAFAVSLGGCAQFESLIGGGSIASSAPTATASAEKGLTIAHLAYQAIGVTLMQAAQNGTLRGPNATTAKDLYDKAGAALDVADQADTAANAQGVADAVAQAEALIAQVSALIPK